MATEKNEGTSTQLDELDLLITEAEGLASGSVGAEIKEPDRIESRKSMSGLVDILLAISFGWFLPSWRVEKEEINKLSEHWGAVLSKHLPTGWVSRLGGSGAGGVDVEIGALKVTWDVFYPRVNGSPVQSDQEPSKSKVDPSKKPNVKMVDSDGDEMRNIG